MNKRKEFRTLDWIRFGLGNMATSVFFVLSGLRLDGARHRHRFISPLLFLDSIFIDASDRRRNSVAEAPANGRLIKLILSMLAGITIAVSAHYYLSGKENLFPLIRNGLYFSAALAIAWLAANTRTAIGTTHPLLSVHLQKAAPAPAQGAGAQ